MRAQELCVPGMERVESSEEEGRWVSHDVRGILEVVMVAVGRLVGSSLFGGAGIAAASARGSS